MLFSWLGRILAILMLIFGIIQIAMGLAIANEVIGPYGDALARYFPHAGSSGAVIDRGVYMVMAGVALGTLAEICFAIRTRSP